METVALQNLGAYSVQVALLVTLASLLTLVLRIDAAPARYGYWRAIFAFCVLLPVLQSWHAPAPTAVGTSSTTVEMAVAPAGTTAGANAAQAIDGAAIVIVGLGLGAAARMLWLAVSLIRLRRLRRVGEPAPPCEIHSDLSRLIGVNCEIRYVAQLRQPVTFGLLRPVVLLPAELATRSEEIQRAVLSHELFHVKRRDWGWLVLEEIVCALLWFNPAVWWMVSRLQLAREVVVDELAVLATGRRRAYVEALMAFADRTSLAPVAAFGNRAQLFNRIVLLSKEAGMSSHRLVFTCAIAFSVLGSGAAYAVRAFPLIDMPAPIQTVRQNAPGPLEQQARPVTPENPIPRRTNYEAPAYPVEARTAGLVGRVTLLITLDELGRVAEARRTRLGVTTSTAGASVQFGNARLEDASRFVVNHDPQLSQAMRVAAAAMEDAAFRAVEQWRYEPPFAAPLTFPVTLAIGDRQSADRTQVARGTLDAADAVRVGGTIRTPMKIKDVRPVYPPEAQAANVSGLVILEALIGRDGAVEQAQVLRSIPMLDQAAVDAVMQWRFRPTLLNGVPVPVIMTVTVNFTLQGSSGQRGRIPEGAVRVHGEMPSVIKDVKPRYPYEALTSRVEGTVQVAATIGTDGTVTDARVVRSIPVLDAAAIEAVRQWKFTPIPAPKTVTIEMSFNLAPRDGR